MPFLNTIVRQMFKQTMRSSENTLTHLQPKEAEVVQKPLSSMKKAAYQFEAKRQLSSKTVDQDLFNHIKARLDQDSIVLNMERKKIANKDWSGLNLRGINFDEARLTNIQATKSRMDGCHLSRTYAVNCNFDNTTLTAAEAECFHGRTSTFSGATLGGNWNRSDLPATIRDRKNVKFERGTQLNDVAYPERSWELLHEVMRRTGNTNMLKVRQALLEHYRVTGKEPQLAPAMARQTSSHSVTSTSSPSTSRPLKTGEGLSERKGKSISSSAHSRLSQGRSLSVSSSDTSSLLPSPVQSTPPTSPEGSSVNLQQVSINKRKLATHLPYSGASTSPYAGPSGSQQAYQPTTNITSEFGARKLAGKKFHSKETFGFLRKSETDLKTPFRAASIAESAKITKGQMPKSKEVLPGKDSDTLMAEWYKWQKGWNRDFNQARQLSIR